MLFDDVEQLKDQVRVLRDDLDALRQSHDSLRMSLLQNPVRKPARGPFKFLAGFRTYIALGLAALPAVVDSALNLLSMPEAAPFLDAEWVGTAQTGLILLAAYFRKVGEEKP